MNGLFRPGDRVGLWARPDQRTLLVFGFGYYEELPGYGGYALAGVRMDEGHLHVIDPARRDIAVAKEESIYQQAEEFKKAGNTVRAVRLADYLAGQVPVTPQQRADGTLKEPEPTDDTSAFGQFKHKMEKARYLRKKISLFEGEASKAKEELRTLLTEVDDMKKSALTEFDEMRAMLNGDAIPVEVQPAQEQVSVQVEDDIPGQPLPEGN